MNNKANTIAKTILAGIVCASLCGTTLAAPSTHGNPPRKTEVRKTPPAPKKALSKAPAKPVAHRATPAPAPKHTAAHRPAPAPRRTPPPPPPRNTVHCRDARSDRAGLVTFGAALIGGIIGAAIGG